MTGKRRFSSAPHELASQTRRILRPRNVTVAAVAAVVTALAVAGVRRARS